MTFSFESDRGRARMKFIATVVLIAVCGCVFRGENSFAEEASNKPRLIVLADMGNEPDETHSAHELKAFIEKLIVYENQAQDDAGAWICHEFPVNHHGAVGAVDTRARKFSMFRHLMLTSVRRN